MADGYPSRSLHPSPGPDRGDADPPSPSSSPETPEVVDAELVSYGDDDEDGRVSESELAISRPERVVIGADADADKNWGRSARVVVQLGDVDPQAWLNDALEPGESVLWSDHGRHGENLMTNARGLILTTIAKLFPPIWLCVLFAIGFGYLFYLITVSRAIAITVGILAFAVTAGPGLFVRFALRFLLGRVQRISQATLAPFYALTDRRALIWLSPGANANSSDDASADRWGRAKVTSVREPSGRVRYGIPYAMMNTLDVETHSDGTGDLVFLRSDGNAGAQARDNDGALGFYRIGSPKRVESLLRRRRDSASIPTNFQVLDDNV